MRCDLKADLKKMDKLVLGWDYYPKTLKDFEARDKFHDFVLNNAKKWLVQAIDEQKRADRLEKQMQDIAIKIITKNLIPAEEYCKSDCPAALAGADYEPQQFEMDCGGCLVDWLLENEAFGD